MPLVTNKITIPFDAKTDELLREIKKADAELARFKAKVRADGKLIEQQAKREQEALKKSTMSITDFRSAYQIALDVIRAGKAVYDFGREGAEIEFLQTRFERLAVSIGTTSDVLMRDLREATRGTMSDMEMMESVTNLVGLGLAKDHDEAIRLARVSAGLNMNMNQLVLTLTNMTTMRFDALGVRVDGFKEKVKELEAQGYDTNEAFKEAFLQQAEKQLEIVGNAADESVGSFMRFEAQLKNVTDESKRAAAEGFEPLIDVMADVLEEDAKFSRVLRETNEELYKQFQATHRITPEMRAMVQEYEITEAVMNGTKAALDEYTDSLNENAAVIELTEEQIKAMTKANQAELDTLGNLTKTIESYKDKQTDLKAEHDELTAKKNQLIKDGWWAESKAVQDVNQKLAENEKKQQENADEFQMATNRRILARAEELASIDGLTTEEKEALIERGIAMGVYTREAAARMREEEQAARDLAFSLTGIPNVNRTVTITTSYVSNYVNQGVPATVARSYIHHASGGMFEIPSSYGNEGFRMGGADTASGGEKLAIAPKNQDFMDYNRMGRVIERAFTRAMQKAGG